MLRIAIATFVACAPLIASAQQGVVRVLGATKKATGTAWFINREDGIFMTAAHVVLASVANPATDAIVLEACHDLGLQESVWVDRDLAACS